MAYQIIKRAKHFNVSLDSSIGKNRLELSSKPINYKDASGNFQAINTDFVDSGVSAMPYAVANAPITLSVTDDGMRRMHPTGETDVYIEIGAPYVKVSGIWKKVSFANAIRTKNSLTWTRTEADLFVIHAGHYIKLGMELKDGYVPEENLVAFPVGLAGLTRSSGNILKDGVVVAHLNPPVVYDAANSDTKHKSIAYEFASLSGQPYLVMTLPSLAGITRPVIDPTLTLQPDSSGLDTSIREDDPTSNFGATVVHAIRDATNTHWRGLFQFDISDIPVGATLTSATLSLYLESVSSATSETHEVHRGLTQWYEGVKDGTAPDASQDGSTWSAKNANGSVAWVGGEGGTSGSEWAAAATDTETILDAGVWHDYNVLDDVQDWYDSTATNYGWWVLQTGGTDIRKRYTSSDGATAANRPKLVIEYTIEGGEVITPVRNLLGVGY